MTFFTTLPPALKLSPKPDTACAPKQMVARAAGLDAARPGQSGADHAADGADVRGAQQPRGIDRLERELLVLGIDQRHHVGQRRAGLRR